MRLSKQTWFLVAGAIVATAVIATLVNQLAFGPTRAHSDEGGTLELRISAKRLADGRVEFAFQHRGSQGWGERISPRVRFFPVDAAVDNWLNSSSIEFAAPRQLAPAKPVMCVVADGDPDAHFWRLLELHTKRAGDLIGVQVRYSSEPDPVIRVRIIEECVANGVPMILATLADSGAVIPALHDAAAHGVKVATFGAGETHADRAGSLIHVSFDEAAAGRRAVEQFAARGVHGPLLCVGKQGNPQGRNGICDVLAERYEHGEVTAHELTSDDRTGQIERLLEEHSDTAGLLVVEADLLPDAIAAMERAKVRPVLGSIGEYQLSRLSFAQRDQIAFTVMDLARVESLLPMAALYYMYKNHPNARFFDGAMLFNGEPNVHIGGATGGHGRPSAEGHGHDQSNDNGDHDH